MCEICQKAFDELTPMRQHEILLALGIDDGYGPEDEPENEVADDEDCF